MAEDYKRFPTDLPPKGDRTVTFRHKDFPNDKLQNLEVLSSISAGDIARLESLGYEKVPGAKPKGPDEPSSEAEVEEEAEDSESKPKKRPAAKATATS